MIKTEGIHLRQKEDSMQSYVEFCYAVIDLAITCGFKPEICNPETRTSLDEIGDSFYAEMYTDNMLVSDKETIMAVAFLNAIEVRNGYAWFISQDDCRSFLQLKKFDL